MNPNNNGESSDNLSGRRKRGRPRKLPTLNHTAMAHQPPHFEQGTRQTVGPDTMVGQAVNGVIEASFDSGYLLSVRIGNSNTNLRGVVFKPGHIIPVTIENDIAPHLEMIQREPIVFGGGRHPSSTRGQKLAVQRAGTKPRYSSQENGGNGVLQNLNFQAGQQTIIEGGANMVEPLPTNQTVLLGDLSVISHAQDIDVSFGDGNTSEEEQGEKSKAMASTTDVDTPGYSSQTSDINVESGKEVTKPSGEDINLPFSKYSGIISNQEIENANTQFSTESSQGAADVTAPPFLNFRTGGMTELLQAVQGNARETPAYVAEPPPAVMNRQTGDFQ